MIAGGGEWDESLLLMNNALPCCKELTIGLFKVEFSIEVVIVF
jgi:hypothetical protein